MIGLLTGRGVGRRFTACLLGLAVFAPAGGGAVAHAATLPEQAFVTNNGDNTVTPIGIPSNIPGAPIPVGQGPRFIAISPGGSTAYLTNDDGTVVPINLKTDKAGTPIPISATSPGGIAITPNGSFAYVTDRAGNSVVPINLTLNKAGTPIPVGGRPQGIAITPDGSKAYVTNQCGNDLTCSAPTNGTVTPINLKKNTAGAPITVGSNPLLVAIDPTGTTAYVTNFGDNTVTPITIATNTAGTPIQLIAGGVQAYAPLGIAITPDGTTAYVTDECGTNPSCESDGTVTPINLATRTAGAAIPVGTGPEGIAITPNGTTVYVVDSCNTDAGCDNAVTPITVATNTPGTPIPVGSAPQGIAIN